MKPFMMSGDLDSLKDPCLKGHVSREDLLLCFNVAALCVQPSSNDRPEMKDLVFRLMSIGMGEDTLLEEQKRLSNLETREDGYKVSYRDEILGAYMNPSSNNITSYSGGDRILDPSIGHRGPR